MASWHVTVGSGDHHVLTLHGWFGSARGKAIHQVLLQAPDRVHKLVAVNPVPATEVPMDEDSLGFIDQVVQHSLDQSTVEAFGAYLQSWATPVALATSIEEFLAAQ
jgi:hypothetical protein